MTSDPHRILVRGVNWLGDAVMTTPALLRLRERFPESSLTMLTPEKLRDLWLHHPALDGVLTFQSGDGPWKIASNLKAAQNRNAFDLGVILPNSPRSALEVWLARIPRRIGYSRPWRNFFLTTCVPDRPGSTKMRKRSPQEIRNLTNTSPALSTSHSALHTAPFSIHQIHDYLHLVATLGADPTPIPPRLNVTTEETAAAVSKFQLGDDIVGSRPVLGMNPGAEYGPAKRWPAERFIAAAREIQKHTNCLWLIFGGRGDLELAGQIETQIGNGAGHVRNLAGKTSLRELMSLLKLCRVLLTNDTGPMHVAAALGTPVVAPFGSTSPELTGPISTSAARHQLIQSNAPCSPCFLRECPIDFRCMTGIAAGTVVEAVLSALNH